jgi:hypothetical protein
MSNFMVFLCSTAASCHSNILTFCQNDEAIAHETMERKMESN